MTASVALAQAAIALRHCLEAAVAADAGLTLARLPVQVALLAHAPVVLAALSAMAMPGNRIQLVLLSAAPDAAARPTPRGTAPQLQLTARYRVGIVAQSPLAAEMMTGLVIDAVHANARLTVPATARDVDEAALLAATGIDRGAPLALSIEAAPADGGDGTLVLRLGPLLVAG